MEIIFPSAMKTREQVLWEDFRACKQLTNESSDRYARRKKDLAKQLLIQVMNIMEIKERILVGL